MRIAFYAPLKSPTHGTPSGDRRVARLLMEALQLAGHTVELASDFRSFDGAGDASRQTALRDEGAALARALIRQWCSAAREGRPDLWFSYHVYYKAPDWLGPEVSAALGIPYVIAEASYAAKRAKGAWSIGHEATRGALRAASVVLCPTRDDLAGVRSVTGDNTRVVQLAPFLDATIYRAAADKREAHRAGLRAAYGLSDTEAWIVVAAMMRPGDKLASYSMLAQALGRLTDLRWTLVVAGDGPARARIQGLLESAAPNRTLFLGLCDAQALAGVYAACDLCVWPAVDEAYGMAMLEAQAAALPVVSCAVRGVPDVVCDGRTGLLAPSGDIQGLADRMRCLLLDAPKRRAMGQAAARFVREERSIAQAAAALNVAFAPLAGGAVASGKMEQA